MFTLRSTKIIVSTPRSTDLWISGGIRGRRTPEEGEILMASVFRMGRVKDPILI